MADELAYSTADGKGSKKGKKKQKQNQGGLPVNKGPCKMRLEIKGRGGKSVTVLFNLPYADSEAKKFMKDLQEVLACGATFKNNQIEFRGDMRNQIEKYCQSKSIKIVRAGG